MLAVGLLTGFMIGIGITALFIFGLMRWTDWLRDKFTVPPIDTARLAEGLVLPTKDVLEVGFNNEEIDRMTKIFNER